MNFFENQFREMFEGRKEFKNAVCIGRACYVPLKSGIIIKILFTPLSSYEIINALRVSTIGCGNRLSDSEVIRFNDYFSPVTKQPFNIYPCISNNDDPEWDDKPSPEELKNIADQISKYIKLIDSVL